MKIEMANFFFIDLFNFAKKSFGNKGVCYNKHSMSVDLGHLFECKRDTNGNGYLIKPLKVDNSPHSLLHNVKEIFTRYMSQGDVVNWTDPKLYLKGCGVKDDANGTRIIFSSEYNGDPSIVNLEINTSLHGYISLRFKERDIGDDNYSFGFQKSFLADMIPEPGSFRIELLYDTVQKCLEFEVSLKLINGE